MSFIIQFFGIFLFILVTNAAKYTAIGDSEYIFSPCEGEQDRFLTKFFDVSKLKVTIGPDDEAIVDGHAVAIAEIKPNDTLWLSVEIFKETRGQYIVPIVEMKRSDLCKALFNPFEAWYHYVKTVEEYLICPCVKGTIYNIPNWSSKVNVANVPDPKMSGAYRAIARIGVNGNEKVASCFVFDFHLFLMSNL